MIKISLIIAFPKSTSELFDSFSLSIFYVPGTQQKNNLYPGQIQTS